MKRFSRLLTFFFLFTIFQSCSEAVKAPTTIDLQSRSYGFGESLPPSGVLTGETREGILDLDAGPLESFSVKMTVSTEVPEGEVPLMEIPGILKVRMRQHDPSVWVPQNYPSFPMPDGTVPVLEASLALLSRTGEVKDLVVGIPLGLLEEPVGRHEVVLDFTGVKLSLYLDGILLDNDFALGYPVVSEGQVWRMESPSVQEASFWAPGLKAVPADGAKDGNWLAETSSNGIQYWIPPYHNSWVGDVAAIQYKGRYHLFYLFDRRGHASKFGKGGHYFEHLSTADFKEWTEHEAATPLEEQWETFGTGTPFVMHDSLFISYGLHTTRMYSREETSLPEQWDYLDRNGKTGSFSFDSFKDKVPDGTTWAVCTDGISHFEKSRKIAHPCENPSIFTDSEGRLRMLANYGAKGTWGSESLEGGWECLDPDFPLGGDCTFPFSWGGYDYIVGGFVSFWGRPSGREDLPWKDMVAAGEDCYNGISVPAVTVLDDGRCIMAGWLKMRNWAGALIIYELVQLPGGALGSKWMEEVVPATSGKTLLSRNIETGAEFPASSPSFILSFEVEPQVAGEGRCSVGFIPEGEGKPCFWSLDMAGCKAQYSSSPEDSEKTLDEGGHVSIARNYAVKNGMELDRPFKVRMAVKTDPRFNGSIIDTEIGGTKTMVSFREGLKVGSLQLAVEGCKVKNLNISKIVE